MTAYDYPIVGLFWTMVFVFFWVALLFVLVRVFADIFRSPDLRGWAKALWIIFVIVVPFLGVAAYVVARAHARSEHDIEQTQRQGQLRKLAVLRERGEITDAEFDQRKAELLS